MPAVSVIVPVYGVEKYIVNCLRSIAKQTFLDFELILVDDGSQDRSIPMAKAFLETTEISWRILVQENQGQGAARDHGIRAAVGDYVVCIDSDDTVAPDFLYELYNAIEKTESDIAFSGFQRVAQAQLDVPKGTKSVFQEITHQEMMIAFLERTIVPILPAMLIRRQMILENNLSTHKGCRFSEDVFFMWLLFSAAKRIVYTQDTLYYYLWRQGSTMTASSLEKILTGYSAFQALSSDPRFDSDFPGSNYLLARWVSGALRSSATITKYHHFFDLYQKMDGNAVAKTLRSFPDKKIKLLALFLQIHPRLFYQFVRIADHLRDRNL